MIWSLHLSGLGFSLVIPLFHAAAKLVALCHPSQGVQTVASCQVVTLLLTSYTSTSSIKGFMQFIFYFNQFYFNLRLLLWLSLQQMAISRFGSLCQVNVWLSVTVKLLCNLYRHPPFPCIRGLQIPTASQGFFRAHTLHSHFILHRSHS